PTRSPAFAACRPRSSCPRACSSPTTRPSAAQSSSRRSGSHGRPARHPGSVGHRREAEAAGHAAGPRPRAHRQDEHAARPAGDPRATRQGSPSRQGRGSQRMKVHEWKPAGRGTAGRRGKTAGRGTKGQGARDTVKKNFEGGQMPLHMRVPKLKGFKNPFRVEYQAINLDVIEASGLTEVSPQQLHEKGLAHKGALIKVLGRGELQRKVTVRAHAFSKSAESAITAA